MITGTAKIVDPDDVVLEVTLRAPAGEWRRMMRQLPHDWPACDFGRAIADTLGRTVAHTERLQEVSG